MYRGGGAVRTSCVRGAVIVGHSMGGFTLQNYLGQGLPAAGGVLLASAPTDGVWRVSLNLLREMPLQFLKVNLQLRLYPVIETPEMARVHFFSADMPADEVRQYHSQLHDESFRAFLDMLFLALPKPKKVKVPMLVLGGENDTIFSVKNVQDTAKAYNTEAVIISDMAHDMMLEPKWQEAADHIATWVKQTFAP